MSNESITLPVLAVIGGTGAQGAGLALRWALAGYEVIIGSRSAAKAQQTTKELSALPSVDDRLRGMTNEDAARSADLVIMTVPFAMQHAIAMDLQGYLQNKILVDVTVPLVPPKVAHVSLPSEGSAVAVLQKDLGYSVKVVSAFQNVSAHHLRDPDHVIDCDVLVCGDDADARDEVVKLAARAGMRGLHAGPICNSAAVEAMTSVLIFMNKRYKVPGSGLRITGLGE